ncbi:conserved hypothetical protein [Afipia carboxidovorans OM5]|nr:conserved hypothetical protein [Afipia carboxidovorans OM5]
MLIFLKPKSPTPIRVPADHQFPREPQQDGASGIYRVLISCNDVLPLRAPHKTANPPAANPPQS